MKMQLTDPQFEILAAAAARGDNVIERGADATEATLRSLAAHHIGTLRYELVGRRKMVCGLYVTVTGWLIYTDEARERERAARVEANARIRVQPVDPFAVHARAAWVQRADAIDAAFA